MVNDAAFNQLRNLKKRIKDHRFHMDVVVTERQRTELLVSISNLENKISDLAQEINWRDYDFSDCVFLDLNDKIKTLGDGELSFIEVSHIWLVFNLDGETIRIDLNRDDFNIDFLDNIKPINNNNKQKIVSAKTASR